MNPAKLSRACLCMMGFASVMITTVSVQGQGYIVSGNKIFDSSGNVFYIHGVARSGYEFSPFGDGHFTDADFDAIVRWHVNTVRVPFNQDYFLPDSSCYNSGYLGRLDTALTRANSRGMNVIFDLHWSDRGVAGTCANGQQLMADTRSVTAWQILAARYANDPTVFLELYNEPHGITWECWLSGCMTSQGWQAVGMQQLYDAVRGAGFTNPVLIGGLNFAYDLTGVPTHRLSGVNIAYVTHPYDFGGKQPSDWPSHFGFLTATDPVIATEFGTFDCTAAYTTAAVNYFDAPDGDPTRQMGWTGWAWDSPGSCGYPSLLTNYDSTPSIMGYPEQAALFRYAGLIPPPPPQEALFIVGKTNLGSGDSAVRKRLNNKDIAVLPKTAGTATSGDATDKAIVLISSTANSAEVDNEFADIPVPVLTWSNTGIYPVLGMTGETPNVDYGLTTSQTQLSISDPTHPLAAGLSGVVTVTTNPQDMSWGVPNGSAASVATLVSDASQTGIFGYDQCMDMPSRVAPARRVGFFFSDTTAASLTPQGGQLFDAAVSWATTQPGVPKVSIFASPSSLWPPNHKLNTIDVSMNVSGTADPHPIVNLVSITCDDSCDPATDIVGAVFGTDSREFLLRAERTGNGNGRTYTITYSVTDCAGNKTTAATTVVVPHDQSLQGGN